MKLNIFTILSLLYFCLAQQWNHNGCIDDSFELEAAVVEAITMAGTANEVLLLHAADAKVQQMLKHILGDDANLLSNIAKAQAHLQGVMKYDGIHSPFLTAQSGRNTDVLIFCQSLNYEVIDGMPRNKAIDSPIETEGWAAIQMCYDKDALAAGIAKLPMAMTMRSELTDISKYKPVFDAWETSGKVGPEPDRTTYVVARTNKVNTIDLCTWYMEELFTNGFRKVDKTTIAMVQNPEYIAKLTGDGRAFDLLSQTFGATILHELSHTELAGRTRDNPAGAGCYGWKCVGALHDVDNADSINILAVALTIWKMGFYVDDDGTVKSW